MLPEKKSGPLRAGRLVFRTKRLVAYSLMTRWVY